MRKLFGASKKKKSSNLKTRALKIPIPMINGVEYANLTESQISTLIGGANKDYPKKKSASSLSSQRTNNTTQTEKVPAKIPVQPVIPSRSISSPPILMMPKPVHGVPPTRYLLGNYEYEKTLVESSSSISICSGEEEDENEAEDEEEEDEERVMSSLLPLKTVKADEDNKSYQSSTFFTRTSDDSIKQYVSASESPFPMASSIVSNMNQANLDTALSPSFSSPSSPVKYAGNDMNHIGNNELKRVTSSSVPLPSSSTFAVVAVGISKAHEKQDTPKPSSTSNDDAVLQACPLPMSNLNTVEDNHRNLSPIDEYKSNISTTPVAIPTTRRGSRPPTSSSGSSATVGHDVTHSQSRFANNNSNKPPGILLQTISSEPSAFIQNNNTIMMDSLTEMLQSEMKKMALNEDLLELKRTVDRMQQQRASDLEDHLTRVAEQQLREKEILEQIKLTKQRLDMVIAENMFANNPENGMDQGVQKQREPVMRSSNSTNTTRSSKLKSNISAGGGTSGNASNTRFRLSNQQQQPAASKQRNRRSLPSAHQHSSTPNEYFPDMSEFNNYPPHFGYPQDYNPEFDMMRMMNGNQDHFVDSFVIDSPRLRYIRQKPSSQRRPRSKSMESRWQEQDIPFIPYPDICQDDEAYYPTPRTRSRKSSLHSAKSSSSDSDNNNRNLRNDLHDNFNQPPPSTKEEEGGVMEKKSTRQPEMGSDDNPMYYRGSGSGRFRRSRPPQLGGMNNMPPSMFGYPNGLPPPLPHPMDRERMKMRPPPPPPPPYGYNNLPPPNNEYFPYMPPSQRISPRMMAALAADEQNQQQQQQQKPYSGYQWGPPQGTYSIPPPT
ncbi:hypothetical protein [Parasitella parasitica]|uniref:Uncharacterized protein n=1 Tax=Parasitella parasitica TaxID=35722 RepID=A0A0B7MV12_9FUNG|nr:hypothetical protein [Parasitella parasitica]